MHRSVKRNVPRRGVAVRNTPQRPPASGGLSPQSRVPLQLCVDCVQGCHFSVEHASTLAMNIQHTRISLHTYAHIHAQKTQAPMPARMRTSERSGMSKAHVHAYTSINARTYTIHAMHTHTQTFSRVHVYFVHVHLIIVSNLFILRIDAWPYIVTAAISR